MTEPLSARPTTSAPREVLLTYTARIPHLPAHTRSVEVWIPLAKTRTEQRILQRNIRTTLPHEVTEDPDYGNDILHLRLSPPLPEPLEIAVDYRARLFDEQDTAQEPPLSEAKRPHDLEPGGLVIIDDEVRSRAQRAIAGRTTVAEQARGIYEDVIKRMAYDKTEPGWGRGDTRRACLIGKGNCTDFHSLFISMARSVGIAARFKIGVIVPDQAGVIPGYHCWAEFYDPSRGWVPVDASEAWKHPERIDYYFGAHAPDRFLVSVGRDLHLVPPPHAGPVNIFFKPYVEVDGIAFEDVETTVQCADRQPQGGAT